jgi:hypothetical protein
VVGDGNSQIISYCANKKIFANTVVFITGNPDNDEITAKIKKKTKSSSSFSNFVKRA